MPSATSPSRLAESWGTHCPTRPSTVERSDATWAASADEAEVEFEPLLDDGTAPSEPRSDDAATGTGTPTVTVGVTTGVVGTTAAGRAARTPTATSTTATTTETPAMIHGTVARAGDGAVDHRRRLGRRGGRAGRGRGPRGPPRCGRPHDPGRHPHGDRRGPGARRRVVGSWFGRRGAVVEQWLELDLRLVGARGPGRVGPLDGRGPGRAVGAPALGQARRARRGRHHLRRRRD